MVPLILTVCFVPSDQRVIIFNLDFTPLRILVVAGALRLWLRGEIRNIKLNRFDQIILLWASVGTVIYIMQWQDMRSLIFKCGILFDILGSYWLFRQNLQSLANVHFIVAVFALCALVMLPFVALEYFTGSNPFSVLGGVVTAVRQSGRYRCQASFPHSIVLGLFWANLVPIFFARGIKKQSRFFYWLACLASILMIIASNSSTTIITLMVVLSLLCLYRYRFYGRQIAYSLCVIIVLLHFAMKAPVWHLASRLNVIGGSTGYHRYKLIDKAVENFNEWALFGTRSTAHWGWSQQDITNQYILEGIQGGFITFILFISVLFFAIKIVGSDSMCNASANQQWLSWGICVSILGHCISFLGVSYFGQIRMLLFLTFALVGFVYEVEKTGSRIFSGKLSTVNA